MLCDSCGRGVVLDARGYYVCPYCGRVIEPQFDSYQRGKEDIVQAPKVKSSPYGRINLSFSSAHYAWYVLGKVSAELNLSLEVRRRLVAEYEVMTRFAARRVGYVKKSAIVAILVYLEHRRRGGHVNLQEVVRIFRRCGFKLRLADVLKVIPVAREYGFLRDSWDDEVEALLEKLNCVVPRDVLQKHVSVIIGRIRSFVGGRSKRNVTAAVVAIVLRKLGLKIDLLKLSKLIQVPYTSLRSNIDFVESLLLEVGLEYYVG